MPKVSLHWILYGAALFVILGLAWLWHDTQTRDQKALADLAAAKSSQTLVDKQADATVKAATQAVSVQNAKLETLRSSAKSVDQQVALINTQEGTHITQAEKPSLSNAATLTTDDVGRIATMSVQLSEAQNQIAVDKLQIIALQDKIEARDRTIKDQQTVITAMNGGSRIKRFAKAVEHVGIGIAVGATVVEILKR